MDILQQIYLKKNYNKSNNLHNNYTYNSILLFWKDIEITNNFI